MHSPGNNRQGDIRMMLSVMVDCLSNFYGLSIHAEFMPCVRVPIPPVEVTAGYLHFLAFMPYAQAPAVCR